jgi:hypothetical protein
MLVLGKKHTKDFEVVVRFWSGALQLAAIITAGPLGFGP